MIKQILTIAAVGLFQQLQAQNPLVVMGGEKGNYILNSFKVASPKFPDGKVTGFKLERSEDKGATFQLIDIFSTPENLDQYKKNIEQSVENCVLPQELTEGELTQCWTKFSRYHKVDSIREYLNYQHILLTLNLLLLDKSAVAGKLYVYKLSSVDASGGVIESKTSGNISYPEKMIFSQPRFQSYEINQQRLVFKFKAAKSGKKPNHFAIYRKQTASSDAFTKIGLSRDIYTEKDSLVYTFIDQNISDAITYFYYIAPSNQFGNYNVCSDTSAAASLENKEVLIPDNFKAVPSDSLNAIALSWNLVNPEAIGSVQLFRNTEYEGQYTMVSTFSPYETAYMDKGVLQGIKYYYYLKITDKFARKSLNGARIFGIMSGNEQPNSVAIFTARSTDKGVVLEWVPNGNNIRGFYLYKTYQIEGASEPVGQFIPFNPDLELYTYTDTVKNNRSESVVGYTVTQENGGHLEGGMYQWQYVVNSLQAVSQSLQLQVDANQYAKKILITWQNMLNTRVNGYNIYRIDIKTSVKTQLNSSMLLPNVLSYTDSLFQTSDNFKYLVEPVMMNGKLYRSFESNEITGLAELPQSPYDIKLTVKDNGVVVSWSYYEKETILNFEVYRWQVGEEPVKVGTVDAKVNQYTDATSKNKDTTILYFVKAVNKNGESKPSSTIELKQ